MSQHVVRGGIARRVFQSSALLPTFTFSEVFLTGGVQHSVLQSYRWDTGYLYLIKCIPERWQQLVPFNQM